MRPAGCLVDLGRSHFAVVETLLEYRDHCLLATFQAITAHLVRAFDLGASIHVNHDFQRSAGLTSLPQQAHELRFVNLDHHALNGDADVPVLVTDQCDVPYSPWDDAVFFQWATRVCVSLARASLAVGENRAFKTTAKSLHNELFYPLEVVGMA